MREFLETWDDSEHALNKEQAKRIFDLLKEEYEQWKRRRPSEIRKCNHVAGFIMCVDHAFLFYHRLESRPLPSARDQKRRIEKTLRSLRKTRDNLRELFGDDSLGLMPQRFNRFVSGEFQLEHYALLAADLVINPITLKPEEKVITPIDTLIDCCEQALTHLDKREKGQRDEVIRHQDKNKSVERLYRRHIGDPDNDPRFQRILEILSL